MKKGPARPRRVFFIGGIEEAFLVGLVSRLENCAEAGGRLSRVLWPLGRLKY